MKEGISRSEVFKMPRWRCYLMMMMHDASWLGWVLLVVVIALTTAGFLFSPWIGAAAIGFDAFIVVMAMSFVIMAYGFNSITGVNMSPHAFYMRNGTLVIEFEEGREMEIPRQDIRPYHIYPGGVLVPVEGKRPGWLWIPPKAFENDNEFQIFLKRVYRDENNTEQE